MSFIRVCYIESNFNKENLLRLFLKNKIEIVKLSTLNHICRNDVIIVSTEYDNFKSLIDGRTNYIIWEDLLQSFYNYSQHLFNENYDYFYLKNSLKEASHCKNLSSLVIGSSYARFGIEEKDMKNNCINLALSSQDFYYASLIARSIIDANNNIKTIFIGSGYYSFFSDLSLNKGPELSRIFDVYYPIFHDLHNCTEVSRSNTTLIDSDIFNVSNIVDLFTNDMFMQNNKEYFIETRDRNKLRLHLGELVNSRWNELDFEVKKKLGKARAEAHNKAIKYFDTYEENKRIISSLIKYCNNKNVSVYMLIFPSSKYYSTYLLSDYKIYFMQAMNEIEGKLQMIDFSSVCEFNDDDFVDMDHLSLNGAVKITDYINKNCI